MRAFFSSTNTFWDLSKNVVKRGLQGVTRVGISHGVYHYSHGSSYKTKKRLSVEDPMVWFVRLFMPRLKLMANLA